MTPPPTSTRPQAGGGRQEERSSTRTGVDRLRSFRDDNQYELYESYLRYLRTARTGPLSQFDAHCDELLEHLGRVRLETDASLVAAAQTWVSQHLDGKLCPSSDGLLRLDAAKVAADAKLDGKGLLRTSDPHLSAEDIALGYKQLLEVDRGWRNMKQVLDLRPVFHRLEDRIRAHVLRCRLALLLIRTVETRTTQPRRHVDQPARARESLQRLHVGLFTGPAGPFRQTTTPTDETRRLYTALDLPLPPLLLHTDTESAATRRLATTGTPGNTPRHQSRPRSPSSHHPSGHSQNLTAAEPRSGSSPARRVASTAMC